MRAKFGTSGVFSSLKNAPNDGALLCIINDDRLTRLAHSLQDGGEVTGVGGGEAGDGFEVVEEGEVVDDEDVGLGDDVGGEGGGALSGQGDGEAKVAALARPAGEGRGCKRAGRGKVVGFVEDEQSAMRWTQSGAQAILDLRAVRINDDWDEYQQFHRYLNIRDSTISTHRHIYGRNVCL